MKDQIISINNLNGLYHYLINHFFKNHLNQLLVTPVIGTLLFWYQKTYCNKLTNFWNRVIIDLILKWLYNHWCIELSIIKDLDCLYHYLIFQIYICKILESSIIHFNCWNVVDYYFESIFCHSKRVVVFYDHCNVNTDFFSLMVHMIIFGLIFIGY